jgi:SRSO17 transposase
MKSYALPSAVVPVSGTFLTFYRYRPKTCWPTPRRTGTKGKLKVRFAAVRVRVADGPPQRMRDKGQQHLPGDEVWLIGEHRMSGEKKYCLANLPAKTQLRTLAAAIKARWICEQAHQQMKEELGLNHFEGRSFTVMRL